jgi:HK97 family phage major capsid protein
VMNRFTQAAVRLKDVSGHYLWEPSLAPGQSPTLLGIA